MSQNILLLVIALAALFHPTLGKFNVQPPYQVSIMSELHPGYPIHCCNGAIIYEKLVITTAGCLHMKFGPKGKLNKLDASLLSVVAGSTNAFTDAIRINISKIHIAENFDPQTLENDLALLTLSKSLPLGTRPDMKWIMLDDNIHVNHSCLANFFSRNSKDAIPNYYQTEELILYSNEICRNFTEYPSARKDDICSIYVLPQQLDCAAAESYLSFNNDRGTGLVCKSYLVGLLSSVVTRPSPENNCSDVTLAAMYTNIFPHLMWVYNIMANIETMYISTPYDASVNSLVINSANTYNNDEEVLTTTLLPLTTANVTSSFNSTTNSTRTNSNSTITNSTTWNPIVTNSTTANSTITNSTTVSPVPVNSTIAPTNLTPFNTATWNSTALNSTTVLHPTVINSTALNSTVLYPTVLNSTAFNSTTTNSTRNSTVVLPPTRPYPLPRPSPTAAPSHAPSTDSYVNYPTPKIPNFFKSGSASVRFSAGCLLIALVSPRLIIYH